MPMDCSALIGALQREPLDQRAVAEQLVQFTKTLKTTGGLRERSGTTYSVASPAISPRRDRDGLVVTDEQIEGEAAGVFTTDNQELEQGDHGDEDERQSENSDNVLVALIRSFRGGMMRVESNLRAAMFRAVRYLINTAADAELLHQQRFGLFIALALAREQLWERMQALKLVKRIMEVDSSRVPREVVQTLVAVSGHMEDSFRRVCLETLRELAVANPRVVAHANGFKTLFAAALDPATQDLVDLLVNSLMSLIENPSTRKYVRPQLDLHQLLSGFTDLDAPVGPKRVQRWEATRTALVVVMRSWTGLHLVASDPRGLVTLMQLLRAPSAATSEDDGLHDVILETLLDIFTPLFGMCKGTSPDGVGNRHGRAVSGVDKPFMSSFGMAGNASAPAPGGVGEIGLQTGQGREPHNLLHSYGAMLCAAFVHCGVIPSLATLGIFGASEELCSKAAGLLKGVLHLCAMFLSQSQCTRLLSMPGLVQFASDSRTGSTGTSNGKQYEAQAYHLARSQAARASDLIRMLHMSLGPGTTSSPPQVQWGSFGFKDPTNLTVGGLMQKIHETNWAMESLDTQRSGMDSSTSTLDHMRRELRLSMETTVEKSVMESQMTKSKVLATKDWTKWDWEVINDMVHDTLTHPPRLVEALRTKWVKRLSGFYRFVGAGAMGTSTDRGGGGGLHNIPWDAEHLHHLSCSCRMYMLLLNHPEGVQFMQTEARGGIFQDIVKELELVTSRRSSSGGSTRLGNVSKVFDMESCQRRLGGEYMTLMFGVATATEAGREMLSKTDLFSHLMDMGSHPELDYLSRIVLTRMDFTSDQNDARDVLQIWMSSGSRSLRLFAANLMRALLRREGHNPQLGSTKGGTSPASPSNTADSANDAGENGFEQWGIDTLVTQLHYDDPAITQAALSVLEEAAKDDRYLQSLVQKRPDLLNKPGAGSLLMRFLSLPDGVDYLQQLGWVEGAVQQWQLNGSMEKYATHLDAAVKAHLHDSQVIDSDSFSGSGDYPEGDAGEGNGVPIPIHLDGLLDNECQSGLGATGCVGDGQALQLILRLPWNIEVVLSRDTTPAGSPLKLDTWVDASPRVTTNGGLWGGGGAASEAGRKLVVRGILIDGTGKPTCHPLESNLTLHTRLCVGSCTLDRSGNVQPLLAIPTEGQATPLRRLRSSRSSRLPPQQTRGDIIDDVSDLEQKHLSWSTCRPRERATVAASMIRGGGESEILKGAVQQGSPEQTMSHSHEDSVLEGSGESVDMVGVFDRIGDGDNRNGRGDVEEEAKVHEYVVNVPGETARWIFTNQPELAMEVVESNSVTFLKAVEFTISLEDLGPATVAVPVHLYGELAKTEKGCELLRMHGNMGQLLETAKDPYAPAEDRKGALWGLAHVSRWSPGLSLLQEYGEDFIRMVTSLCTSHLNLTVWGTCFCAISLVAQTAQGRAAIRAAGWESARDPSTNVFLPQDPAVLFQPVPWDYEGAPTHGLDQEPVDPVIERIRREVQSQIEEREVLEQVAKLSSHISRKEAKSKLGRMRKGKTHRSAFTSSIRVFLLVHQLLAEYSFSLPVRRYIFELFDQATPSSVDWEPYIDDTPRT